MIDLPRVAVLGVPRGGTSAVVGLLRILGYRLPDEKWEPHCIVGEARGLRTLDPIASLPASLVARRVSALPDGVVWKDPGVGDYADQIDLSTWKIVHVYRQPADVARSERRHGYMLSMRQHQDNALRRYSGIWEAIEYQRVSPTATVNYEDVRAQGLGVLTMLARRLELDDPTQEQRDQARVFLRPDYRCPLPETCTHDHSALKP